MLVDSQEVAPGVVLDYDVEGNITGIDIDKASKILDLKEFTLNHLPVEAHKLTA